MGPGAPGFHLLWWLVRFCDYRPAFNRLARNDALARTVIFILIQQGNTADGGFEGFHAQIAARIIFHVRHHEPAAPLFGCDIPEDGLDFPDLVGQDCIGLHALPGCKKQVVLHFTQKLVQLFPNSSY